MALEPKKDYSALLPTHARSATVNKDTAENALEVELTIKETNHADVGKDSDIEKITILLQQDNPFTLLGSPIYHPHNKPTWSEKEAQAAVAVAAAMTKKEEDDYTLLLIFHIS